MLRLRVGDLIYAVKRKDWYMSRFSARLVWQEIRRKFDSARNSVLIPLLSSGAKERALNGVAPYMFWDYGSYTLLIAESLREAAKERTSNMIRWPSRKQELSHKDVDKETLDMDKETVLLNKWADILSITEIGLMDEPYYQPYWDYLEHSRLRASRWDGKGKPTTYVHEYPERTAKMEQAQKDLQQHEHAIHMLQVDILMELAENHRYLWD